MSHGRFGDPVESALTGIEDLFGRQALAEAFTDDPRADGRTCLVTGATSGLGVGVATQLAECGDRVITVSRSDIVRDATLPLEIFLKGVFRLTFRAPAVTARPAVYACTSPDFESETNRHLHSFDPKRMDEKCYDEADGARLWERSAALCRDLGAWPS